jgi:hypothetical protein
MNNANKPDAIDAEFEEVKVSSGTHLPALPYSLWRHPLMATQPTEKSILAASELEIDKQLGLGEQAKLVNKELLSSDIDTITEKFGYPKITGTQLRTLFAVDSKQRTERYKALLSLPKAIWRTQEMAPPDL